MRMMASNLEAESATAWDGSRNCSGSAEYLETKLCMARSADSWLTLSAGFRLKGSTEAKDRRKVGAPLNCSAKTPILELFSNGLETNVWVNANGLTLLGTPAATARYACSRSSNSIQWSKCD